MTAFQTLHPPGVKWHSPDLLPKGAILGSFQSENGARRLLIGLGRPPRSLFISPQTWSRVEQQHRKVAWWLFVPAAEVVAVLPQRADEAGVLGARISMQSGAQLDLLSDNHLEEAFVCRQQTTWTLTRQV